MIRSGRFRADLYHRISVTTLELPPLRERREDLAALVEHMQRRHGRGQERGAPPTAEFMRALASLPFPGNLRELENLVRTALARAGGARPLGLADLPDSVLQELAGAVGSPANPAVPAPIGEPPEQAMLEACDWNLERALETCEGRFIARALSRCGGNQMAAASLLGVTARTIYNKMRKYHLGRSRGLRVPESQFHPDDEAESGFAEDRNETAPRPLS
jgi:DNA-binding NtrC family response regulator